MFKSRESLPRGYRPIYRDVDPVELYELYRDVEKFIIGDADSQIGNDWEEALADAWITVGVRAPNRRLAGVGFLYGDIKEALLCDLVVHPDHRSKGIGSFIVRRRVEIAQNKGVEVLRTDLAPSNTLRPLYHELGFELELYTEGSFELNLRGQNT